MGDLYTMVATGLKLKDGDGKLMRVRTSEMILFMRGMRYRRDGQLGFLYMAWPDWW